MHARALTHVDGYMICWMDEWMDGWMDGWMDEQNEVLQELLEETFLAKAQNHVPGCLPDDWIGVILANLC